jgi:hypothetical protein
MPTAVLIGAYATSPPPTATSRLPDGDETAFYTALKATPDFGGFEVPVFASGLMHALDEPWLISALVSGPADSTIVLTMIPGTMVSLGSNPAFGLASTDASGRAAALDLARAAAAATARLNAAAGRRIVAGVQLHSGPSRHRGGESSAAAFEASLVELARLDWAGASLIVEHCDALAIGAAPAPGFPAAKGFLTFEEELDAIARARAALAAAGGPAADVVVGLNWARSVIETHSASTPLEQVRAAAARGIPLGLVVFSGCSAAGPYGVWEDSHAPFATDAPDSLLTEAAVGELVASSAISGAILAVKLAARGSHAADVPSRVAVNAHAIDVVTRAVDAARKGSA